MSGLVPNPVAPRLNVYNISENVALKKVTYQHGTYLSWNSSRAVDGNRDQDGTYGSCAWAHNDDDVFKTWWNVDLKENYYIHSMQIFFRTDGKLLESSTRVILLVLIMARWRL